MQKVYWYIKNHPLEIVQEIFNKIEIIKKIDDETILANVFYRDYELDYCGRVEVDSVEEKILYLNKDAAISEYNIKINKEIESMKNSIKKLKKKII